MSIVSYEETNQAKVSFDDFYTADTPHDYLNNMAALDYRMAERMHPFLSAVTDLSLSMNPSTTVLDIGCSYGISGAMLKTGCSYKSVERFYRFKASSDYALCVSESKDWLKQYEIRKNLKVVGLDSSEEAVKFAIAANLINSGIATNLETNGHCLTPEERQFIAKSNVLFSAGTVGYVGQKTIAPVLLELGLDSPGRIGPMSIVAVLELFEVDPIAKTFMEHGFLFESLPIRIPQRRFANGDERNRVIRTLKQRGDSVDSEHGEEWMFARLCIGSRPKDFKAMKTCVLHTAETFLASEIN